MATIFGVVWLVVDPGADFLVVLVESDYVFSVIVDASVITVVLSIEGLVFANPAVAFDAPCDPMWSQCAF